MYNAISKVEPGSYFLMCFLDFVFFVSQEKIRADIAKLQQEEGQLGNTKSKELLDAE